jgi:hypothetical protein
MAQQHRVRQVERAASMTTSFLTSLNFMGRAVCGIWSKQMPVTRQMTWQTLMKRHKYIHYII